MKLAGRVAHIAPFYTMELMKQAHALQVAGRDDIIHLSIGEPDFTAPHVVVDAAISALAQGKLQYTHAAGLPALREAIAAHYQDAFGVTISPERIVVTAGASGALLLACAALVNGGDEVLMPDPCYPCNRNIVLTFDGVVNSIPCDAEQKFQLTAAAVAAHWGLRSRGICIASPSNPTGTSIASSELAGIMDFVRRKGGFVIVDEIYQGLSYDTPAHTALALDQDIIVINSFSKYFDMTGWRLGWMVVPEYLAPAFEKLAQNLFICASSVAQHAALACFTPEAMHQFEARRVEFKRRRDYLVPALRGLGFTIPVMPDGAFYVYADCSRFSDNADQFAKELLVNCALVVVPGLDFGPALAGRYIRLSYATSMQQLEIAVARLSGYLAGRKTLKASAT
jgi:aspartate/methionine/tyrosine aminotransferase